MNTPSQWGAEFLVEFNAVFSGHEYFIQRIQQDAISEQRRLDSAIALSKRDTMDAATCNVISAEILNFEQAI